MQACRQWSDVKTKGCLTGSADTWRHHQPTFVCPACTRAYPASQPFAINYALRNLVANQRAAAETAEPQGHQKASPATATSTVEYIRARYSAAAGIARGMPLRVTNQATNLVDMLDPHVHPAVDVYDACTAGTIILLTGT